MRCDLFSPEYLTPLQVVISRPWEGASKIWPLPPRARASPRAFSFSCPSSRNNFPRGCCPRADHGGAPFPRVCYPTLRRLRPAFLSRCRMTPFDRAQRGDLYPALAPESGGNFGYRFSSPHPHDDCRPRSSEDGRPFGNGVSGAVVLKVSHGAKIVGLLCWCSPATVFWLVVSVWVDSVKSHSFRLFAHVSQEVFKRLEPSIANFYAASAIDRIFRIARAIAPVSHSSPRRVGRRRVSLPVSGKHGSACIAMKAAARFCFSAVEPQRVDGLDFSAVAGAHKPANRAPVSILPRRVLSNHGKPAESQANKVFARPFGKFNTHVRPLCVV